MVGPTALLVAKRTKRCGLAVSATGRLPVFAFVPAFPAGKRLSLLQGGQALEAGREVWGFREGQAAGHPVYLFGGYESGGGQDCLPVSGLVGVRRLVRAGRRVGSLLQMSGARFTRIGATSLTVVGQWPIP